MAENGILDYQGMNQAIYRGATSNIVVDTQSMSIEIGAGNTSHTSNLHFECNHDANVASIKLNSNVVTEFPRSKKLIKYPRVVLNSASQDGYVVTASTDGYVSTKFHRYDPFRPFVSGEGTNSANGWHSGPPDISVANNWDQTFDTSGYNKDVTSYGVGGYAGTSIAGIESEWLKLELPHKIVLSHFYYQQRDGQSINYGQAPRDFRILGSNDDVNWDTIQTFTDQTSLPEGKTLTAEASKGYKYLAFVVTKTWITSGTSHLTLKNLEYYGVPEYDPDAHGTDVVVKSVPNVPNTDWLEVYYDAKGLTDISSGVSDLSGNSINGVVTGATLGADENIDIFNFDGQNDIIQGTFSGHTLSSGYTMATWIKPGDIGADDYIATFGVGSNGTAFGINFQTVEGAFRAFIWGSATPGIVAQTNNGAVTKDKWVHVAATFISADGTIHLYIDNKLVATGTGTALSSISSSTPLVLGARNSGGTIERHANFKMANFRLFNRALTSDEVWQLYAYQKEYFGHGDLSMTLKAGRLGIGTSEPRAMLDVKGIARFKNVFFYARANLTGNFDSHTQNTLINDVLQSNGDLKLSSDGRKVIVTSSDAAGVYVVFCQIAFRTSGTTNRGMWARLRKNGVNFAQSNQAVNHITSSTYTQHVLSGLIDLDVGDEVHHYADGDGNIDVYTNATHFYMYRIST